MTSSKAPNKNKLKIALTLRSTVTPFFIDLSYVLDYSTVGRHSLLNGKKQSHRILEKN